MTDASSFSIKEHSKVVGTDGQHLGIVDHVEGDRIKLTKSDSKGVSPGVHSYVPISMVASVDAADGTVRLNVNAEQAKMAIKSS